MLGVALVGGLASCSDDDDNDINPSMVPAEVKTTFDKMFPGVRNVDWEMEQGFYVADFTENTYDKDAWFTSAGNWAMTETDYNSLTTMLPTEVQTAFGNSKYASWIIDDVQYYERPADSFCLIEVETEGMPEVGLFYDTFGNLINEVQGDYFDITPNTVVQNISF